jgi:hypothetical protein
MAQAIGSILCMRAWARLVERVSRPVFEPVLHSRALSQRGLFVDLTVIIAIVLNFRCASTGLETRPTTERHPLLGTAGVPARIRSPSLILATTSPRPVW